MSEVLYNCCVKSAGQASHGLTLELELSVLLFLFSFVLVCKALWSTRVGNLQQSFYPSRVLRKTLVTIIYSVQSETCGEG